MSDFPTPEDKRTLLRIARQAITAVVLNEPQPVIPLDTLPQGLCETGASFVTLTIDGGLRGCIGSIEAVESLALDVQRHAVDAAFADPRFPRVTSDELGSITIEISILTEPKPLDCPEPEQRPACLRPGVDGVLIRSGVQRSTFLPQVWEKLPDPVQFLEFLCQKACLARNSWKHPDLEVLTYQVIHFDETLLSAADSS
ncbi:MAG: AmmeMemoRadiSam system protein A [Anaerolineales bacterium]|nr:AmmeMemoRadiSam system protein A [Anaerolineales bacterium]